MYIGQPILILPFFLADISHIDMMSPTDTCTRFERELYQYFSLEQTLLWTDPSQLFFLLSCLSCLLPCLAFAVPLDFMCLLSVLSVQCACLFVCCLIDHLVQMSQESIEHNGSNCTSRHHRCGSQKSKVHLAVMMHLHLSIKHFHQCLCLYLPECLSVLTSTCLSTRKRERLRTLRFCFFLLRLHACFCKVLSVCVSRLDLSVFPLES
jgi:hypothetical protein